MSEMMQGEMFPNEQENEEMLEQPMGAGATAGVTEEELRELDEKPEDYHVRGQW